MTHKRVKVSLDDIKQEVDKEIKLIDDAEVPRYDRNRIL